MIDTAKLTLDKTMFSMIDRSRFERDAMNPSRGYFKMVQNPTTGELKQGIYKPRLTLTNRFNHSGRSEETLAMEFSAPKLIFGNNFDELTDKDFLTVIQKLQAALKEMGVRVFKHCLIDAPVSAVHYSKNIALTDYTTPYTYISQLRKANINKRLQTNQTDFRNEGHSFKYRANSFEIAFYDKIRDLQEARTSEKRAEEEDNALQLSLLDVLEHKEPFEVLRFEVRLNQRWKINQILKKVGVEAEPTFNNLFSQDIAKKVLLYHLNEIEEAYPPLLAYQCGSPREFFTGLLIANPTMKLTPALKMLGLRVLLDGVGVREFREIIKRYGNPAWYNLNREMKELNTSDEKSVFSVLRKELNKFKPLKLVDFLGGDVK